MIMPLSAKRARPGTRRVAGLTALVALAFAGLQVAAAQHVHGQSYDGPASYHCALAAAPGLQASPDVSGAAVCHARPFELASPDPAVPHRTGEILRESFPRAPPLLPRISSI
jgi:hypothetical protein